MTMHSASQFLFFAKNYDYIEDKIGRKCSKIGGYNNACILIVNTKQEKKHSREPNVDGSIILKRTAEN